MILSKLMKLLIFETHPIQYRAPVYQHLEKLSPGQYEVVYASDFSVRGYRDKQFGATFSWDTPLLSGYNSRVLNTERAKGIESWRGLSGKGVFHFVKKQKPKAILLHSFSYEFCIAAYFAAKVHDIPIWIRMETQDNASPRGAIKATIRSLVYRMLYKNVSKAFYIGSLNRSHLMKHGVDPSRLRKAHYCTPNTLQGMTANAKQQLRSSVRTQHQIPDSHSVITFVGKLIAKKNPELIFRALKLLPLAHQTHHVTCLFVGTGELDETLRTLASDLFQSHGIRTLFAGFVNQTQLPTYYLASDIIILPSRQMGETWGLVVNEGLQSGCAVIVTNTTGCSVDFGPLDRVRVIRDDDATGLINAIESLQPLPRSFDWASDIMPEYSIEAAAATICREITQL